MGRLATATSVLPPNTPRSGDPDRPGRRSSKHLPMAKKKTTKKSTTKKKTAKTASKAVTKKATTKKKTSSKKKTSKT